MNSLTKKIIVALFAVMLSISLIAPGADAIDHCVGSSCLHCNPMMLSVSESELVIGSDGPMCDSSFANSPCKLNNNPESNTKIFIVSSIKQNRQETGNYLAIFNSKISFLQSIREDRVSNQFRLTTGTIPIYLQNLSFLC